MRFATIGTNFITDRLILNGRKVEGFRLEAVYSRTEERGREYALKQGADKVYTSLDEMAADPDIDAVYIGSPTCCHAEQAIRMMEAGKHVLCEKPMCSNLEELERMYETAQRNHVVLLEAMRPWYCPGFIYVQELLPKIGPIHHATFFMCQYSSRYNKFKEGIVENAFVRELSNGGLMDVGCYAVAALAKLFGEPKEVKSMLRIIPGSIDSHGAMLAGYDDMIGEVMYSKVSGDRIVNVIQGEYATVYISPIGSFDHVEVFWRDLNKVWYSGQISGQKEILEFPTVDFAMNYEVEEFLRICAGEKSVDEYREASFATMKMMDAIRRQGGYSFPADDWE
ncbi:MAG: Gfo/Idh/MocA family oxidoreductase [Lachnospiraceae bacterium]|nr:Gfo/Idh/MocA family oxidoreductase [Lachnospiraceae bacterium]